MKTETTQTKSRVNSLVTLIVRFVSHNLESYPTARYLPVPLKVKTIK